jgi:hypothetical protein
MSLRRMQCSLRAEWANIPWRMVEAQTVQLCTECSAMIIVGLILSVFAIGFFCWLLFTLAVYALPLFIGITAAFSAYHHGSGIFGAILIAALVGGRDPGNRTACLRAGPIPPHPCLSRARLRRSPRGGWLLRDARTHPYRRFVTKLV